MTVVPHFIIHMGLIFARIQHVLVSKKMGEPVIFETLISEPQRSSQATSSSLKGRILMTLHGRLSMQSQGHHVADICCIEKLCAPRI